MNKFWKASASRNRWEMLQEAAVENLIRLCGLSAILFVFGIFLFVFREGSGALTSGQFNLFDFLAGPEWNPTSTGGTRFGTLPLLTGTLAVTLLAMAIAVPVGLGGTIFISEFCSPFWRETLKVSIEFLAAIPSVVWGFIGLMVMSPLIVALTGAPIGLSVLNGGIILALMSVPIIASIGEDALKAVPDAYREAAIAAGATRWQLRPCEPHLSWGD